MRVKEANSGLFWPKIGNSNFTRREAGLENNLNDV